MTAEHIKKVLIDAGITVPEGEILDASYRLRTDDWYVQTEYGWFWWDARSRKWLVATTHNSWTTTSEGR